MPRKAEPERKLGTAIRGRRHALGISQEEAADLSGLDRSYYGSVERGERNISIRNIVAIAKALKVTAAALLSAAEL